MSASKTLRFSRLTLRNWRNFISIEDLELSRRVFIVGPNAIGKSNLLDVFRFMRDLVLEGGGLAKALELRGGLAAVRSLHARQMSDVFIGLDVVDESGSGWRYELAFNRETAKTARAIVVSEKAWKLIQGDPGELLLDRPDTHDRSDKERLTQTALQQTTANQSFRGLADFLRGVSYLHLVPQLLREEQVPLQGRLGIDPFGRDLLERIQKTTSKTRGGRLKRIQKVLKVVAPQLQELSFVADDLGRPHLAAKFQHWRAQGAKQRETQFSDGTLRLIGLLWTMQEKTGPLLLEEPELSLHTGIVSRLAPFIHRAQVAADGRQVILSTHAEHLLADPGISPEEVFLVRPAVEGSEVVAAAENDQICRLMQNGILASEAVLPQSASKQLRLFDRAKP
ncbi:MAG: AAA family ATPase [Verrucomicrobiaceae bacterium]|nr:AAA family ATPase [Verrucomicrobiaceae bacterium]